MAMGYTTSKEVTVSDKRVVFTYWFTFLAILTYIIGYQMLWGKAYLERAPARGTVELKIKGEGFVSNTDGSITVWDEADLVPVALENAAAFVVTNKSSWLNQHRCQSAPRVTSWCSEVNSSVVVEPVFQDDDHRVTIWFRGQASFPTLDSGRMYHSATNNACVLHPAKGFNCFDVPTLARLADSGSSASSRLHQICGLGCIILVNLHWSCDVSETSCHPEFRISRLDTGAQGFNTRAARHFRDGTTSEEKRDLYKYYGMRVLVLTDGQGYKVSIVAIFTQLGSAIGLLSIAAVVADFLLKNLHRIDAKRGDLYKRFKIEEAPNVAAMEDKEIEILEHTLDQLEGKLVDTKAPPASRESDRSDVMYHHLKG
eukprot:TRINITY_DN19535_c0_g1_i1.p1 TRINITY_DN19535_c0_g1~~TRINITY_DN19535_c0_g1_i1.p1  ORF type:complete len:370 (-),score=75.20 TRINITY_DN19535_c0_g1_i1:40-1149(-)